MCRIHIIITLRIVMKRIIILSVIKDRHILLCIIIRCRCIRWVIRWKWGIWWWRRGLGLSLCRLPCFSPISLSSPLKRSERTREPPLWSRTYLTSTLSFSCLKKLTRISVTITISCTSHVTPKVEPTRDMVLSTLSTCRL